jgi:hypothetical protein
VEVWYSLGSFQGGFRDGAMGRRLLAVRSDGARSSAVDDDSQSVVPHAHTVTLHDGTFPASYSDSSGERD